MTTRAMLVALALSVSGCGCAEVDQPQPQASMPTIQPAPPCKGSDAAKHWNTVTVYTAHRAIPIDYHWAYCGGRLHVFVRGGDRLGF